MVSESPDKKEATIYLYGFIGIDWWSYDEGDQNTDQNFIKQLNDLQGKYDRINIHINSPGGDMMHGNAIVTAIQGSKAEIHTYNDGIAASMAAVIFCSAPKGQRHMAKNALTMFHSPSSLAWGNARDMRQEADVLDKFQSTLVAIVAEATQMTDEEVIATYMDHEDHWLTYAECLAANIVDDQDYKVKKEDVVDSLIMYNNVFKKGSMQRAATASLINKNNIMPLDNQPVDTTTAAPVETPPTPEVAVVDALPVEVSVETERIATLEQQLQDAQEQLKKINASLTKATIIPATQDNNVRKTQDELDLERFNLSVSDELDRNQNFRFD